MLLVAEVHRGAQTTKDQIGFEQTVTLWTWAAVDGAPTSTGSLISWSLMAVVDPSGITPTPTPAPDQDGDGVEDALDNCPLWSNPSQNLPPWPSGWSLKSFT